MVVGVGQRGQEPREEKGSGGERDRGDAVGLGGLLQVSPCILCEG